ncbi:MAG: hypothetical protein PGN12_01875 [Sphingomonas phyllosphaerae]
MASFREQISELQNYGFPHEDGVEALSLIDQHFRGLADEIEDTEADMSPGLIDGVCVHVTAQVGKAIVILGLILRSTNVRNPFELHYALAQMVRSAIGRHVRVLVSSEWTYTPFTWPMNFDLLPDFVIIGTPASESSNALVAPLAGHEIGHSAWRHFKEISTAVAKALNPTIDAALERQPDVRRKLLEELKLDELGGRVITERCAVSTMKQVEEVFCDLFGLYLFGTAYLHAYDYLVAPGAAVATLDYPSDERRVRILCEAAHTWDIPLERDFTDRWRKTSAHPEHPRMYEIVSEVVDELAPQIRSMLFEKMQADGVQLPNEPMVTAVMEAFKRNEPYDGRASVAEIVIAGWRNLLSAGGLAKAEDRDRLRVLNDLMLKSIEVAEYRERTQTDA